MPWKNDLMGKSVTFTDSIKYSSAAWLVTGGCGFIGLNFIASLLEESQDLKVRVLDDLSLGTKENLSKVTSFVEKDLSHLKGIPQGIELVVGDIRDYQVSLQCCNEIDIVVHLAASTGVASSIENPQQDMEANVVGTLNMLEAARHNSIRRFVFASSGAPLGECNPPIHEELAPRPLSPYGASKLAGEGYCSAYCRTFGVETVALRFGNVYGPFSGHKNSVVAKFIMQALRGQPLEIYGDGMQTRDFIYIDDLVRAILLAAGKESVAGEIFQIATSAETAVKELVERLLPILREEGIDNVEVRHTTPRLGDMRRNYSDTSKARRLLGWHSQVKLEDGLKKSVQWFLDESSR
jgi:UDP-glucose 4-epimerase